MSDEILAKVRKQQSHQHKEDVLYAFTAQLSSDSQILLFPENQLLPLIEAL